ncbi:VOC family protein [Qipengyuania qiaonensis]|uniref:VOC family protein n=1 Tax=Qipengyuania qiaonensis TaxID=2867240 RepID=A0ABS7J707_9SPHN|nr:VOC family protein [Qipengyuania qiaonensis]MBX7483095.1 VOC family protein [Qipengyuania qiaonensis]
MTQMIFVNLPVSDLAASTRFYEAVGFTRNPQFSNEMAACMVLSDAIHVMLLTHDFWKTFTSKAIPDARDSAQVLLCLSRESREAVDAITANAQAAGGIIDPTPTQDMGFMYGRSFEDPDGHIWEVMWMDPQAAAEGPPAEAMAN